MNIRVLLSYWSNVHLWKTSPVLDSFQIANYCVVGSWFPYRLVKIGCLGRERYINNTVQIGLIIKIYFNSLSMVGLKWDGYVLSSTVVPLSAPLPVKYRYSCLDRLNTSCTSTIRVRETLKFPNICTCCFFYSFAITSYSSISLVNKWISK